MRVLLDTSIIVEIDRHNEIILNLLKKLAEKDIEVVISSVTISEILTGSYLMKDFKKSVLEAKKILSQFLWFDLDGEIAEKTAQLLSYLILEGKPIEYQDVVIAATFFVSHSDYLLTLNKDHFKVFPDIKDKTFTPEEFNENIKL
jgi:predicted nucleic acid-binding protein